MIYSRRFQYGRAAMLKCDKCGRELYGLGTELQHFMAGLDLDPGQEPTIEQRTKLRQIAQDFGWLFMLVDCDGDVCRDLCPDCFCLPEEG